MMEIFLTVTGSNHRLTQPQTVGKKEGAPIIWWEFHVLAMRRCIVDIDGHGRPHKYSIQGFRIM